MGRSRICKTIVIDTLISVFIGINIAANIKAANWLSVCSLLLLFAFCRFIFHNSYVYIMNEKDTKNEKMD